MKLNLKRAIYDNNNSIVWGIGNTEEEAWTDARESGLTRFDYPIVAVYASDEVAEYVDSFGGDVGQSCYIDGHVLVMEKNLA